MRRDRLFREMGGAALLALLLLLAAPLGAQLRIVVEKLPENTPHDAALYLTGDFNGWNPGDSAYRLARQPDGSWSILLAQPPDSFGYKFTRGNWSSVEGRKSGRARSNRIYQGGPGEVRTEVLTWEDLAGNPYTLYTFILLLSAFQGILLILAINGIQDNNVRANRFLSALILLISFALVGRVATYDRDIFNWQPKLFLAPEMIFFLYGPVFYLYIRNLLKLDRLPLRHTALHFLPALIHLLSYLPYLPVPNLDFKYMVLAEEVHQRVAVAAALALGFNYYYFWRVRKLLRQHEAERDKSQSFEQNLRYLRGVMALHVACLALWLWINGVYVLDQFTELPVHRLREFSTDLAWAVFSCSTYLMGYFAMNQPEIFKLPPPEEPPEASAEKYRDSPMPAAEMDRYKTRLDRLMQQQKVFTRPELTLPQLSDLVGTSTHTLSRVINEGFGMSFYDYINQYRVEEFNRMMQANLYPQETLLAVAFRAGFNSKTTFNRAFKKITGKTPREHLKQLGNFPEEDA